MKWNSFTHGGKVYDLAHLHLIEIKYVQEATKDKPPITYTVDVTFSLHCFTKGLPENNGPYDRTLLYRSANETRLFNFARYAHSKLLPDIIRGLTKRKCMHTGHGNFFTVEVIQEDGSKFDYDIFFKATKSLRKGRVSLFIQSAFVREKDKLESGTPVRFTIILHNILNKRPIRG